MKKKLLHNTYFNLIILVIFAMLSLFSIILVRTKLLQNAQEMGTYLARNYSTEEEVNMMIYQTLIGMGTEYIDDQTLNNPDQTDIENWIYDYYEIMDKTLDEPSVRLYALVDDEIIASNPWDGMEDYNFKNTHWYQEVMHTNNEVVFTDTYKDASSDNMIITIAKKAQYSNTILVTDVLLEDFHNFKNLTILPEGSSYYLCDRAGNPLYYLNSGDYSYEDLQGYVQSIFQGIKNGHLAAYDQTIYDLNGDEQGVYYHEMSNGWISILTIPIHTTLEELRTYTYIFSSVFLCLLLLIIYMTIRDFKVHKRMNRSNEIVQVLGNSYYAIFSVNYKRGTYEMIKSEEDLNIQIPKIGSYTKLLDIISSTVDKTTSDNLMKSFSLENIRNLVSKQVHDFGGDYLRQFGTIEKWVNLRVLFDETLDPGEVVLCFQEVDKEKRNQLEQLSLLQSALEAAQRNEKEKTNFFSSWSHDMRTPLNGIIGLSELAQYNLDNRDKLSNYIQKIRVSSRQLLELINDLLELSRLESGSIAMEYTQVDFKQCILEYIGVFQELAQKENKIFEVNFDIRDTLVMCSPLRISQILNNLISNAFKYSNVGATIKLSVKQCNYGQNAKYQIIVSDNGIGMSQDFLPQIFDSYAQENRFGSKGIMGTGLGMPIVKRLVKQMNGEITVESELGKGSTFTVTLPLKIVDTPEHIVEEKVIEEHFTLQGKHILLVEDNEINMEITNEILTMNEVIVHKAWNGLEAVEAFKNSDPFYYDAILMDMLMPKMNGCEASKAIRSLERPDAKEVPIIAVTANAFAEDIAMTTEAGMNIHVSKPIDFNVLCQALKDLIHKD